MPTVIDAHVHFFDPRRPGGVTWPPVDSGFHRPTLPGHLVEIAQPVGIAAVIAVECSRRIEDNEWLLQQAAGNAFVAGVVGFLDPWNAGFVSDFRRFSRHALFRGIRVRPEEDEFHLSSRAVREALRVVADAGLTVDFLAPDSEAANRWVDAIAGQTAGRFMLNHFAHARIDGGAPTDDWLRSIARFAALPNVWCKVSRLTEAAGARPAPESVDYYRPWLDALWRGFGPARLVFGSNWPPCTKAGDYCTTVDLVRNYVRGRDPASVDRVMASNAARFYRARAAIPRSWESNGDTGP
jgi:L-fuconolactonase